MNAPRASVIAATYNQSRDLDLHLISLRAQSEQDFEIIIADDGSREDTKAVIDRHREEFFGDRLVHLWQEDDGFRKSKILNQAILRARADWLIFTDCDSFLHSMFIEDHISMKARFTLFMGRRVDLSPELSEWARLQGYGILQPRFLLRLILDGVRGRTRNINRGFRVGSAWLAEILRMDRVPDLLGSNFSVDRELLFRVNGFEEGFVHYWGEDGDLFVRLRNAGARILGRKSFAIQYHLWHRVRDPLPGAKESYQALLRRTDYVRCTQGLEEARNG